MSGDRYKIGDQNGIYFLTFTVVDWIDVFTRQNHKLIIVDSLNYCINEKGLIVYAWCLMSNHIHLIASAQVGFRLSDIIRDFKKFTSKAILNQVKVEPESRRKWMLNRFYSAGKYLKSIKNYKFWKEGNHAIELSSPELFDQRLHYIHQNPITAMIVDDPSAYLHSSARDYQGIKGLVAITLAH